MPTEPPASPTPTRRRLPPEEPLLEPKAIPNPNVLQGILDAYGSAIIFALILDLPIWFLSAMILDGGLAHAITTIAVGAHFGSSLVNILIARQDPSTLDLLWVRFGLFPCMMMIPVYISLTGGSFMH